MVWATVEVDVDLTDFDTDDLERELESRGVELEGSYELADTVRSIYEKRRIGKNFDVELDELIYRVIGRIV